MAKLLQSDTLLNQHSYYEASVVRPHYPLLEESIETDVLVIGGGFAGLSAAIELAQKGLQVVVLEAKRVCYGASGRNGGQAIVGFASGQGLFESQLGAAAARQIWDMSLEAISIIDERIQTFAIDCDRVHGYLYVADSARKAKALVDEMQEMQSRYGLPVEVKEGAGVQEHIASQRYCASAYESVSGHLHPLKYGLGLAKAASQLGVRIFEHSSVEQLGRGQQLCAKTHKGQVRARFGVLAGNCMLPELAPEIAPEITPRIMPVGTYMIASSPVHSALAQTIIPSNAAVCDNNFVLDYFRFSAERRMLFGGRVSYTTRTPKNLSKLMRERMVKIFPQLADCTVDYTWGGFVDISMNRAPDFGRLGSNLFYLQGFSGHGVAATGLAGRLVAECISGQASRFDLFAKIKHRAFPGGSLLRTPTLATGMLYYRLKDLI